MTAEQAQTLIDAVLMLSGIVGALIVAATWRG